MTPAGGGARWRYWARSGWIAAAPEVLEPPALLRRRRRVALLTLVVGALVLAWTLRLEPGSPAFYGGTLALACVWALGAMLSGPLHLGRMPSGTGQGARPVWSALVVGVALLALFLLGALLVARIPFLREPVDALLAHARYGSLPLVALLTALNGVAEEVFFRGALYAASPLRYAVPLTTVVYAAVTAGAGVPLLVFAALVLGVVTALQRRATGGILAPCLTHLVWSLGMLFLLPPVLSLAS